MVEVCPTDHHGLGRIVVEDGFHAGTRSLDVAPQVLLENLQPHHDEFRLNVVTLRPEPVNLRPDLVTLRPDIVKLQPDLVTLRPEPVNLRLDLLKPQPDLVTWLDGVDSDPSGMMDVDHGWSQLASMLR